MKKTYRKHSPAFKTKVVLEALKERETLSELAQWSSPLTYRTRLQWQNCKLCPYEQQTEVQQGREAADRA